MKGVGGSVPLASLEPLVEQKRIHDTGPLNPWKGTAYQGTERGALARPQDKLAAGFRHAICNLAAARRNTFPVLVYDLDLLTTVWWLSGKELVDSWAGPQLACVAAHVTVWGGTFITFGAFWLRRRRGGSSVGEAVAAVAARGLCVHAACRMEQLGNGGPVTLRGWPHHPF